MCCSPRYPHEVHSLKISHSGSIAALGKKEEVFCLLKSNENLLQGKEKPTKIVLGFEIVPEKKIPANIKYVKRGVISCRGPYGF
ncbi:hypothetical protein AF332_07605 [Sporosarcina globispora]|uniref:Uncharacterized protein n=1 Tax=Sporosarcina globispora TaxID=1459 RepID=A0A0M0GA80_SPOGL|nr:hypothetical protein AF332_07605 [Sporosarcina globispora]